MNAKQRRDARRSGTPSPVGTGPAALLMAMGAERMRASMTAAIRPAIEQMEDELATLRIHVQYLALDNEATKREARVTIEALVLKIKELEGA